MSSFARALSQMTVRSLRSGSGKDISIGGLPRHLGAGDCVRSEATRSEGYCTTLNLDQRAGDYSETRTGTGGRDGAGFTPQPSHAFDRVQPISRPELGGCDASLNSHLSEDANRLGKPWFAILVLILTAVLMTTPSLIAVITILNTSFDLSHAWSKRGSDLSSELSYAGLLIALLLAFTVRKAPREQ